MHTRSSKHAQMHATELFQALYFQNKTTAEESIANAIIFSIRTNGLMVYVPKYPFVLLLNFIIFTLQL